MSCMNIMKDPPRGFHSVDAASRRIGLRWRGLAWIINYLGKETHGMDPCAW
jgi:hypothetical protein